MVRTLLFCSLVVLSNSAYAQNRSPQAASPDVVIKRVDRHVDSMERRMAQEDQQLQARMAQIAKMRASALKREDSRALKSIEVMEQQAYKSYESRMSRILSELNGDPTRQQRSSKPTTRRRSNSKQQKRKATPRRTTSRRGTAARGYRR